MPIITPDQWIFLSPHLDELLEAPEAERLKRLASLRGGNPVMAEVLEGLLREHRSLTEERFLEGLTVELPNSSTREGQSVGTYTLLSEIGRGGMSSVWLAERSDGRFERKVAVKFLNLSLLGSEGGERFKREGKILGLLVHPHIAELVDAGVTSSGQPYLVLEYIDGDHVDRYCDDHGFDIPRRIRMFLDVLDAVEKAHANLIVHRDIKPSNVLMGDDGRVKLVDFGIAKLLEREGQNRDLTQLSVDGGQMLTPQYAAPEQLKGEAVTTATDVYALGNLLYLLLSGEHPSGPGPHTAASLVKAIVDTEPVRLSDVVAQGRMSEEVAKDAAGRRATTPEKLRRMLRGDLDTIVAKALKKDPAERYSSVTGLADDLRRYLRNEPISARPDTLSYRVAKFVRRNRLVVSLAALAVVATAAGVVSTLMQARTARNERDFAYRQVKRSAVLNEFHQFLLSDAAPSGKPFTVNALLNRAQEMVARQPAGDDPNRVEIMVSIGDQFYTQDQAKSARSILEEAYRLSQGIADVSVRARAACSLAASVSRDEEVEQAEKLYHEGMSELPEGPQYALERVACLQSGIQNALVSNEVWEGLRRAQEAQRVLRESPFDSDVLEIERWMDLAGAYSRANQGNEALIAYERAGTLLTSLGRDNTTVAAVLYQNWATGLDQMGRPLEAEARLRRAVEIERTGETEDAVSPVTLVNYAKILRELGRLDEAADYAERSLKKAQSVHHQIVVSVSMIERARIYTAQGNPARAWTILAEVEAGLKPNLPPGHFAFAILASEQALSALGKGDVATALKLADQAVTIDEVAIKAGGDSSSNLPSLLIRRSTIKLEAGHAQEALDDVHRALNLLQQDARPGNFSCIVGHAYLNAGRAELALRQNDEARVALQMAADHLQATLGKNHPDTLNARQLAGVKSSRL